MVRSLSLSSIFNGLFARSCMGVFGRRRVAEYFFLSSLAGAVEASRKPPTRRRLGYRESTGALPPVRVKSLLMLLSSCVHKRSVDSGSNLGLSSATRNHDPKVEVDPDFCRRPWDS